MVNINIEIPEELHKRLKLSSLLSDKTLKEYITESLYETVSADHSVTASRTKNISSKDSTQKDGTHGKH